MIPLILGSPQPVAAQSGIIYVDGDAACTTCDGLSWTDAYTNVQDALAVAVPGDEIWVAEGVYYPDEGAGQTDDARTSTFALKDGVALYGGFVGGETARDQRDPQTYLSVLSGDLKQDDPDPDGNGITEYASDIDWQAQSSNARHVVSGVAAGQSATLDGFVISAGYAEDGFSGAPPETVGAGLYHVGGALTLANLTFCGNEADDDGGGIYNDSGDLTLTRVTFRGNISYGYWGGGGMFNTNSSPTLTHVIFEHNEGSWGSGMYNYDGSSPRLTNVTFSHNSASYSGGGMANFSGCSPTLINVTLSNNHADDDGGGIANYVYSYPVLVNTIMWGNTADSADPQIHHTNVTNATISYSLIQGSGGSGAGWDGDLGSDAGGNLDADPRFMDAVGDNLRLANDSPAIDAGTNLSVTLDSDLDGHARRVDMPRADSGAGSAPLVDIGAYEAHTFYVDADATCAPCDGLTWSSAYTNVQDALLYPYTYPGAGYEIWVAEGVYYPDEGGGQTEGDVGASFVLTDGVALYGGFAGVETARDQRDPQTYISVLSGDIDQDDLQPIASDWSDIQGSNAYHVVRSDGVSTTALLDGFTICAGDAAGGGHPGDQGGGLYNDGGHPTLANLILRGNRASDGGGGMINKGGGHPVLTEVVFEGNWAGGGGGGMHNMGGSAPTLNGATFEGNQAADGGGMYNDASHPVLVGSTFEGNQADQGGGLSNHNASHPLLANSLFVSNTALNDGGGVYNHASSPRLINLTLWANYAERGGGMVSSAGGSPTLTNGILWDNLAGSAGAQLYNDGASPSIGYSDIQGSGGSGAGWDASLGSDAGGNLDADPGFGAPAAGDFYPRGDSPVIDAGDNGALLALVEAVSQAYSSHATRAFLAAVGKDLAGVVRYVDLARADTGSGMAPIVDMGAYEAHQLYVDDDASPGGDGQSWASAYDTLQDALAYTRDQPGARFEIWIAEGVYYPDEGGGQTDGDVWASFALRSDLALYGGFAGDESSPTARDPQTYLSLLSGDISQDDTRDAQGITLLYSDIEGDNAHHVLSATHVVNVVLEGLTVSGGESMISHPNNFGGGMVIEDGELVLRQMNFVGNLGNRGGGLYSLGATLTLDMVTFSGNAASTSGGGMCIEEGSATLSNLILRGNHTQHGGGIYSANSALTLVNAVFSGNRTSLNGAGIYLYRTSLTLVNATFNGNRADALWGSTAYGGGIYNNSGTVVIQNSILWGNQDDEGVDASAQFHNAGSASIYNSLIQGSGGSGAGWVGSLGSDGGGNLDTDPLLGEAVPLTYSPVTAPGNLRLRPHSPAIDAGSNTVISLSTDLEGYPRLVGAGLDMGGYENQGYRLSISGGDHQSAQVLRAFADPLQVSLSGIAGDPPDPGAPLRFEAPSSGPSLSDSVFTATTGADGVASLDVTANGLTGHYPVTVTSQSVSTPVIFSLSNYRILYVDADATCAPCDGLFWTSAYTNLQDALLEAAPGEEIWVAEGIYYPDIGGSQMDDDVSASFVLTDGVALYGGFVGSETDRAARDWHAHPCTLSGDIGQDDPHDARGLVTTTAHISGANALHVISVTGALSETLLDGFNITAGDAGTGQGGGLFNNAASATLRNLIFTGNRATQGGGIYNEGVLSANGLLLAGNHATEEGGSLYHGVGILTLTHASLAGNSAGVAGGGLFNLGGSISLTNSILWGNTAPAGAQLYHASLPPVATIGHCDIQDIGGSGAGWDAALGSDAGGNLDADPLFAQLDEGDLRLLPGSPAIDAGGTTDLTYDLAHRARAAGAAPDLGAYESQVFWLFYYDGDGQSAALNSPFDRPLQVGFWSLVGDPVGPGGAVRFDAPGNGPSLSHGVYTATTDASGIVSLTVTANGIAGTYPVTATSHGSFYTVPFTLRNVPCPGGEVLYVDRERDGDGGSWETALPTLQDALDPGLLSACGVREIWVAEGVYYPDEGTAQTDGDVEASFALASGVGVYGGFAGGETERAERDWRAHPCVLSGDIGQDDISAPYGVVTTTAHISGVNASNVLRNTNVFSTAVLDGFTITAGDAALDWAVGGACGGGMLNYGSDPSLSNLIFSANRASVVQWGRRWGYGGGMANLSSNPVLSNVVFYNNLADYGGGMYNKWYSWPLLNDVQLTLNQAVEDGGGMYNQDSWPTLINVTLRANRAVFNGGGMYNNYSIPALHNVLLSGNLAGENGGGIANAWYSDPRLVNVTLSGNRAALQGGGLYNTDYSTPTLQNSILWANQDGDGQDGSAQIHNDIGNSAGAVISTTLVQGSGGSSAWDSALGEDGGGNLDTDPRFVAPVDAGYAPTATGDLHLFYNSPAIGVGDNEAMTLTTDLGGHPRIVDGRVDLGAYEFQGYRLSIAGGDQQHALINTPFASPLQVLVSSNPGETGGPEGTILTFTAPHSGPSLMPADLLTATVSATGTASVTVQANGIVGSYPVTVMLDSIANTLVFSLTNTFADLHLAKTVTPTLAEPGQLITYVLALSNTGTAPASGVVVSDRLSLRVFSYLTYHASLPLTQTVETSYTWALPDLAPGQHEHITLTGVLSDPLVVGTFTNTASITSAALYESPGNNVDVAYVTVINVAPVLDLPGAQSVSENDVLTFTISSRDPNNTLPTLQATDLPASASFTVSTPAPDRASGTVTWTPDSDAAGTYIVTFSAGDGVYTTTETLTITVHNTNRAPLLTLPGGQVVYEGQILTFTVNSHDPDGTAPTLNADNLPATASLTVTSNISNDISGLVIWTPDFDAAGLYTMTFSAGDGVYTTTEALTITVQNVNRAPVADAGRAQTAYVYNSVQLDGSGSFDPDADDRLITLWQQTGGLSVTLSNSNVISPTFTAPAITGTLTFSLRVTDTGTLTDTDSVTVTITAPAPITYTLMLHTVGQGSVTPEPDLAGYIAGTHVTLTAKPSPGWAFAGWAGDLMGLVNPADLVMDGDKAITVTFTLSTTNHPPAFTSTPVTVAYVGQPYAYSITAQDVDGDPLTITWDIASTAPAWLMLTDFGDNRARLSGVPPATGVYTVALKVSDGDLAARQAFALSVKRDVHFLYLPLVFRDYMPPVFAPDLVVEAVTATANTVQVTIRNQGNAAVASEEEFWLELYIAPDPPPTAVNQLWYDLGDGGIFWAITADLLPLPPGASLTLSYNDAYYMADYSRVDWPLAVGTPLYAQVDAYSYTDYGVVRESHEILGMDYNNIAGPFYVGGDGE